MHIDLVRAWKDLDYRRSLGEAQFGQILENPAGEIELSDSDLQEAFGTGFGPFGFFSSGFGWGNFNEIRISNCCSHNCSWNCDIRESFGD